jgi:hypothetical protein
MPEANPWTADSKNLYASACFKTENQWNPLQFKKIFSRDDFKKFKSISGPLFLSKL